MCFVCDPLPAPPPIKDSLPPPKCVSDSSHRAVIPRRLTSSEEREGPQLGGEGVSEGHPSEGRGTARPLPRGPAELGGAKAATPPVPRGSGAAGPRQAPGELCQPRGAELGCVLSAPQSASLSPEPDSGHRAAPTLPGRDVPPLPGRRRRPAPWAAAPGEREEEARPPAGSPAARPR